MIEIRGLTRKYGDFTALRGVSTSIREGEIVGLLGHNGAGKTTMMKMMTGYLEPTEGSVKVDGLDAVADRQALQRRIGYLPENAPTYPEMLVQEYLAMMAELRGVEPARVKAAVVEAAKATDLIERLTQPIGTLSKGLRQRVGIAQAIVHNPPVLILDEPTNGLDPAQIRSIRELIHRLGQRATVLLSTHILQEVEAVCSRVLVLIGGELVADAPLRELLGSRSIRLSVPDGADVAAFAVGVTGVTTVESLGTDERIPGHTAWRLACEGDGFPVQAVIDAASAAGVAIGAIAPESKTLESVFRDLEGAHIARGGAAA